MHNSLGIDTRYWLAILGVLMASAAAAAFSGLIPEGIFLPTKTRSKVITITTQDMGLPSTDPVTHLLSTSSLVNFSRLTTTGLDVWGGPCS